MRIYSPKSRTIANDSLAPDTWTELMKIITDATDQSEDECNIHVWRGQADIKWHLHSSAYRRISSSLKKGTVITESRMITYEKKLLAAATHRGYRYVDGQQLSDVELLARLQHHGAATRLIDVSRNVLVGIYFACAQYPDRTGGLFGINDLNLSGAEGRDEKRSYSEFVADLSTTECYTWQPPDITRRISAQQGQFVCSQVVNSQFGSLAINDEMEFIVIPISPEMKKICLQMLRSTFDIRELTLFPDIDGFGRAHGVDSPYNRYDFRF